MTSLTPGTSSSLQFDVTDADTAIALGSGSVPVLATPRLIAWLEATAVNTLTGYLEPGSTTVGTLIDLQHLAATAVGGSVRASATVIAADARTIEFEVEATDTRATIATGRHVRAVVETERFLKRL